MEQDVSPSTRVTIGATGAEEVVQNVATVLATPKGSVSLDREFGTEWHFVDQPTTKAMARIRSDIVQALQKYEPRARVKEVLFERSGLSGLTPTVRLEIFPGD